MDSIIVPRKIDTDNRVQTKVLDGLKNVVQKSDEWFSIRKSVITASSASDIIYKSPEVIDIYNNLLEEKGLKLYKEPVNSDKTCNTFSSEYMYYKRKLGIEKFVASSATLFGQKYENPTLDFYKKLTNTKDVNDYGILLHSEYPYIGASPDGITSDGKMIEIKSLYSRKIIEGYIPLKYYIQVQIQLEVCDLEECDYIEAKYDEYTDFMSLRNNSTDGDFIGVVADYESEDRNNTTVTYPYEYTVFETVPHPKDLLPFYKPKALINYFKMTQYQVINITRDRQFFKNILPYLEKANSKLKMLVSDPSQIEKLDGLIKF